MTTYFKDYQILSFFIYFIPFFLLTGSFLPDLFLSISSVIFLYILYSNNERKYLFNYFTLFFLLFYLYLILSSIISDHTDFSLRSSTFYFRYGLFSLAVWYVIDKNPNFIKNFLIAISISFLIAILDGYYQFYAGEHIFNNLKINDDRLSLPFNQKLVLGAYISRLFPLLLALLIIFFNQSKTLYVVIGILLILTDTLIYLTGERTALGLMMVSTLFILAFLNKFRVLRLVALLTSLFVIIIISFSNPDIKQRNYDYTISQLGLSENSNKIYLLSPQHESHFKSAWLMFKDNKLFGVGPNNFRKFCSKDKYLINHLSCSTHPHNTYIQILAETGIIGISFIIFLMIYFFKKILIHFLSLFKIKFNSLSNYQVCIISCFALTLFPFLPTLNFFNNWINVIYFLPVGFYLQSIFSRDNNVES